jgi:hypothetical protein
MPALCFGSGVLLCAYYVSAKSRLPGDSSGVLRFEGVPEFRLGKPNDEALDTHPLHQLGLECYEFHLVENSPKLEGDTRFRHWIVTFHDETLEVIAREASATSVANASPEQAISKFLQAGGIPEGQRSRITQSDIEWVNFNPDCIPIRRKQ